MMSVVTRVVGHEFADHRLAALVHPQPWLLAVVALTGLLLAQTAFRIAPLSVSLPVIDVGEPVVASVLAVLAFGEELGNGPILGGVLASGALVVTGVALLDSSPVARAAAQQIEAEEERRRLPPDMLQQPG
jgi:drug/metabolite transporter (DMT)-like permease